MSATKSKAYAEELMAEWYGEEYGSSLSECCGAPVSETGFCSDCREHA